MADSTRLDKFLWSIRVFKTRSDATDACRGGKVTVGGVIQVRKGPVQYKYKVLQPIDRRQGAALVSRYAENLTPESELSKLHAPHESFFVTRDRGAGRPTKKERRQMDTLYSALEEEFSSEDF